jgi:glycosyltransferase involved in cell wall biosynthesis
MKIMVDASITSKGGGVQVALSLIENIAVDPTFEVICVVNPEIDKQLSILTKQKIKHYYIESIEPIYRKFLQGKRISEIEKKYNPSFVFVVFGPAYWKPNAKTLQGFALGKILYEKELNISIYERILNFIKKKIFQASQSYLLVETELVKKKLAAKFNYSLNEIYVIGNSYSPKFKKNILDNEKEVFPLKDKFRILVPGSYYQHKNLERIILALSEVKKYPSFSQNLEIVFTIPKESVEWKSLLVLAENNAVQGLISTAGFVENSKFAELYLKSHAIICASLVESSTAVFPETFLAKRPLLVSNRPFAKELCEDAALYFNPLDEKDIAHSILKIVSDVNLQKKLIDNGEKVLLKNYPSAEQKWALQKKLIIELANK